MHPRETTPGDDARSPEAERASQVREAPDRGAGAPVPIEPDARPQQRAPREPERLKVITDPPRV